MSVKLPPEIEKIRDEKAAAFGIQVAKHAHERLPPTKFFNIPQNEFDGKPDFATSSAYRFGFDAGFQAAVELAEQTIVPALDNLYKQQNNPNMLISSALRSGKTTAIQAAIQARDALAEWREKVGGLK